MKASTMKIAINLDRLVEINSIVAIKITKFL